MSVSIFHLPTEAEFLPLPHLPVSPCCVTPLTPLLLHLCFRHKALYF